MRYKYHIYQIEECPFEKITPDYFKFLGLTVESCSVSDSDFCVVPLLMNWSMGSSEAHSNLVKFLDGLEPFRKGEKEHIFFLTSDVYCLPEVIAQKKSRVFTISPYNTVSFHYPLPFYVHSMDGVEIQDIMKRDIRDAKFDVSFCGCLYSGNSVNNIRKKIDDFIRSDTLFRRHSFNLLRQERYFWVLTQVKGKEFQISNRNQFFNSIADSIFVLCPAGTGVTSSRFFEALMMGRIPIIISDYLRLPLDKKIEWDKISIRVPEYDLANIDDYIDRFVSSNDISISSSMCKMVWEEYFQADKLPFYMDKEIEMRNYDNL